MQNNAESVVQIDPLALDKECINLPSQYLKYAHISVEAKRDVEEKKAVLDVTEADLAKKVRDEPSVFGLEKVTESALNAVVITLPKYKEALKALHTAQYEADMAQAVVWALEHKKRSLTMLVELHGMGYFANPKVSERGKQAVEEMTKRSVRRRWQDD